MTINKTIVYFNDCLFYKLLLYQNMNFYWPLFLATIRNQRPLIILKGSDDIVLIAITFTLLYVHCCPLFQDSVT